MAFASWVYITVWISISCTMILFNKVVLVNFPFPIFLTCWHMLFATTLTQVIKRQSPDLLPSVLEKNASFVSIWKKMLPVAFAFSLSLIFSNKTYLYLSVSYIQMLKAFTPVAVLILSVINGLEKSSLTELVLVLTISVGIALTTLGESYFSLTGFIFQVIAIVFESIRLVLTNVLLKSLQLDALSTLYFIAPFCFGLLFIAFICFELTTFPMKTIMTYKFVGVLLVNAVVAFSLNIALVCVIKYTSAVALTLAGVLKDILLVILSMTLFHSPVTKLQFFGYSIALLALNAHKEYKKDAMVFGKLFLWLEDQLGWLFRRTSDNESSDEQIVILVDEKVSLLQTSSQN